MNPADVITKYTLSKYDPDKDGIAQMRLVNGTLEIKMTYYFHTDDGSITPAEKVTMVATAQQLADLKTILVAMYQATNAEFDSLGLTKYEE